MDENVYVAPDGKRYRAVFSGGGCEDCAFGHDMELCRKAPECWAIWLPDDAPAPSVELTSEPPFPGTLRDWFAGMVLQGILVHPPKDDEVRSSTQEYLNAVSGASYLYADAMLQARKEAPNA